MLSNMQLLCALCGLFGGSRIEGSEGTTMKLKMILMCSSIRSVIFGLLILFQCFPCRGVFPRGDRNSKGASGGVIWVKGRSFIW